MHELYKIKRKNKYNYLSSILIIDDAVTNTAYFKNTHF